MNAVHRLPHLPTATDELHRPPIDEAAARAAVLQPDGEAAFVEAQVKRYESANKGVEQAIARIALADERLPGLRSEKKEIERRLRKLHPARLVITAEREDRLPLLSIVTGVALFLLGFFGLCMLVRVTANYVARSGADLYPNDPEGAALFVGVALLAGAALKASEYKLIFDASKAMYNRVLLGVGLTAFLVWSATMAITFAPNVGSGTAFLTGEGSEFATITSITLVASHLISDVACSYAVFAGAEHTLLAGRKRQVRPNPLYEYEFQRRETVCAHIADEMAARAEAEDYLSRFASGRADTEVGARMTFQRMASQREQARDAAIAASNVTFLN